MNALIRKEIRLIFPAWAIAVLMLLLALLAAPAVALEGFLFVLSAIGAVFLGLLPFGMEFSLGTFSTLLVQPTPRRRLWRIKTVVLAAALVSIWVLLLCGYILRLRQSPDGAMPGNVYVFALVSGLIAFSAYAGGLWTTLAFRQIAAAFWFTLLLPPTIVSLVYSLSDRLSEQDLHRLIVALLVIYGAASVLWARRQFLRAQDVQWTGGDIALPAFAWRRATSRRTRGMRPRRALFWKEIQAHQSSLVIAGGLLVLHIGMACIREAQPAANPGFLRTAVFEFFWALWLGLPLLIGSSSVAEERRWGTHEQQMCLPATRRSQVGIKLAVALVLGVVLGGCVPALVESTRQWMSSSPSSSDVFVPTSLATWCGLCAFAAWITLVAFHTSTLARNTLQSAGLSAVSAFVLTSIVFWAATAEPSVRQGWQTMPLIAWIGAPILLLTLLGLAFRNFRQVRPGWTAWLSNILAIAFALLLSGVAATAVHRRVWESAARFGPPPGPAQLKGPIRPQILAFRELFLLLPDGRLWTPTQHEVRPAYQYYEPGERMTRTYSVAVPTVGTFVTGSNWVKIAGTYRETVGLRRDGSLWRLLQSEAAEQIGSDSNWKDIVSGSSFFIGLKNDGTLWGWGYNYFRLFGPDEKEIVGDPVQIGKDHDWQAVFSTGFGCIGIKKDTTVWRWGHMAFGPPGWRPNVMHTEPVDWPLDASNWLDVQSAGSFDLILRTNGTLWVSGHCFGDLLGTRLPRWFFSFEPVQVGKSADWTHIDHGGNSSITAIRAGQILFQDEIRPWSVPWIPEVWRPSRRSDWIAVSAFGSGGCLALAADGTLSLWGHPAGPPAGFSGLLAPSRKPLWTVNLISETPAPGQR
jgi:hypothetical protein